MKTGGIGKGPHSLPYGGRFDSTIREPAANLCKKIGAVVAACLTFIAVNFAFWWGASSEWLGCVSQADPQVSCGFNYGKALGVGAMLSLFLAVVVYRPLNERAQRVLVS